jgi:predicted nucleic acid-binding protein
MRQITLVDTSSWIHLFRPQHDPLVRNRVTQLVKDHAAVWCDVIRIELWNGMAGEAEVAIMNRLEELVEPLPIDEEVWKASVDLTKRARAKGLTVPSADLIITACAWRHRAAIDSCDKHFALLEQLR